ncbi:cholesterol esterase [Clydaea vesicula]|uniref:Cholesterol esterase n=1 Tax=Clydaea vesicula TaxID=447962 RepID=A0AAD5XU35_9FUNG|nr:cholesterol esterase [Clydaea vesicula]
MSLIPVIGRLGPYAYFRMFAQLTFAFTVLILEPPMRLIFLIFPLKKVSDIIRKHILSRFYIETNKKTNFDPIFLKLNTTEDFVRYWKFPFESHYCMTTDDFILNLHRIKTSRREEEAFRRNNFHADEINRPVVLFWHGFLMCSEVWVCRTDIHANLPFLLADLGYDVWLGNTRGNKYSSKHKKFKPSQENFWDFSIDQLAFHDLKDSINYILSLTGAKSLSYIGYSQGTVQGFSSLSINHDLKDKINIFIGLSPVIKPHGIENKTISTLVQTSPDLVYLLFGRKCLLSSTLFWQSMLSPKTFATVIDIAIKFLFSWDSKFMLDKQVVYRHLYSFSSVKVCVHWFQILRTGRLQMYDDSPTLFPLLQNSPENQSTNQTVPKFPTYSIRTPIALFYGGHDTLLDMDSLLERLGVPPVFCLKVKEYEHLQFLWGENIEKEVYPCIIQLLRDYGEQLLELNDKRQIDKKNKVLIQDVEEKKKLSKTFQVSEELYSRGKGTELKVGAKVNIEELCWGLDDELGPTYILPEGGKDVDYLTARRGSRGNTYAVNAIGRSRARLEPVTVNETMAKIIVFDAEVSVDYGKNNNLQCDKKEDSSSSSLSSTSSDKDSTEENSFDLVEGDFKNFDKDDNHSQPLLSSSVDNKNDKKFKAKKSKKKNLKQKKK